MTALPTVMFLQLELSLNDNGLQCCLHTYCRTPELSRGARNIKRHNHVAIIQRHGCVGCAAQQDTGFKPFMVSLPGYKLMCCAWMRLEEWVYSEDYTNHWQQTVRTDMDFTTACFFSTAFCLLAALGCASPVLQHQGEVCITHENSDIRRCHSIGEFECLLH